MKKKMVENQNGKITPKFCGTIFKKHLNISYLKSEKKKFFFEKISRRGLESKLIVKIHSFLLRSFL